jgi:hypothetical protein
MSSLKQLESTVQSQKTQLSEKEKDIVALKRLLDKTNEGEYAMHMEELTKFRKCTVAGAS